MKKTITIAGIAIVSVFTLSVFAGVAGSIQAINGDTLTPRVLAAETEESANNELPTSSGVANNPSSPTNTTTTNTPPVSGAHATGTNIVSIDRTVYIVDSEGKKRAYPTWLSFISYPGNSILNVKAANSADMLLPTGVNVGVNEGVVISDGKTVYLIKNGQKHGFTNANAFFGLGYTFDLVLHGDSPSERVQIALGLASVPTGEVITSANQTEYQNTGSIMRTPLGGQFTYGSAPTNTPPTAPVDTCAIEYFNSDPANVAVGQNANIKWKTANCTFVILSEASADTILALSKKEIPQGYRYSATATESVLPYTATRNVALLLSAWKNVNVTLPVTNTQVNVPALADQKALVIKPGTQTTNNCSSATLSANPSSVAYNAQTTLSYSLPTGCTGYIDSNTDASFFKLNLTGSGQVTSHNLIKNTVFVLQLTGEVTAKGPSASVTVAANPNPTTPTTPTTPTAPTNPTTGTVGITMGVRNITLNHSKFLQSTPASVGDTVEVEAVFKNTTSTTATLYFSNDVGPGLEYIAGSNSFGAGFETMFTREAGILVGPGITYRLTYRLKVVSAGNGTLTNTILDSAADSSAYINVIVGSTPTTPTSPTSPPVTPPTTPPPAVPGGGTPGPTNATSTTSVGVNGAPSITFSMDKANVSAGDYITFTWSAQNATFCVSGSGQRDFPYNDEWSGGVLAGWAATRPTSGSLTVGPVFPGSETAFSQTPYWLGCQNDQFKTNSAVLYVNFAPGPLPKVSAPSGTVQPVAPGSDAAKAAKVPSLVLNTSATTISSGSSVTLNWTANEVTACYASGGQLTDGWAPNSGPTFKQKASSQAIFPTAVNGATTNLTYILTCYGQYGQTVVRSVNVQVNP